MVFEPSERYHQVKPTRSALSSTCPLRAVATQTDSLQRGDHQDRAGANQVSSSLVVENFVRPTR